MSEVKKSIDYKGFKGAGAPNAPPPQKPNTNPTRARLLMLIFTPILVVIAYSIFSKPFLLTDTLISHIIGALCTGFTLTIMDWIIEAYAHKKGLWFCYGGFQKIGKIDFKHVPFEMLISFVGMGFGVAFITYYPELFRYWGWDFWPISNPNLDIWLVPGLIAIVALIGAFGDFQTKRMGVWMNGPTWSYWKCAFYAWFPLLSIGIIVDRLIMLTWTNPLILFLTIITIFIILITITILVARKV
jgi:hypothetical protein